MLSFLKTPFRRFPLRSLLFAGILYAGVVSTSSVDAKAEQSRTYNYYAVCDFISARFSDVDKAVASSQRSQLRDLGIKINNASAYEFRRGDIGAVLLDRGGDFLTVKAEFGTSSLPNDYQRKKALMFRLGAVSRDEESQAYFECDASSLKIRFAKEVVVSVEVSTNFID